MEALFVNATKIYQFKVKDSEIKDYALRLQNISKDFTINNMQKNNNIKRNCNFFFLLILILLMLTIF